MLHSIRYSNGAPAFPATAALSVDMQRQLARDELSCIRKIVGEIVRSKVRVVALEGDPGVGKTTMVELIKAELSAMGIPVSTVSTDKDLRRREGRAGRQIVDFHNGRIERELIQVQFNQNLPNGGAFDANHYNGKTGERDRVSRFDAPGEGVLLVEGFTSSHTLLTEVARMHGSIRGRVLCVFLDRHKGAAERQRAWRDMKEKGLSEEEALGRIREQRAVMDHYQEENIHDWGYASFVRAEQRQLTLEAPEAWRAPNHYPNSPDFVSYRADVRGPVTRKQFVELMDLLVPDPRLHLGVVVKIGNPGFPDTQRFVLTPYTQGVLFTTLKTLQGPSVLKIYVPRVNQPDVVEWGAPIKKDPILVRPVS